MNAGISCGALIPTSHYLKEQIVVYTCSDSSRTLECLQYYNLWRLLNQPLSPCSTYIFHGTLCIM